MLFEREAFLSVSARTACGQIYLCTVVGAADLSAATFPMLTLQAFHNLVE